MIFTKLLLAGLGGVLGCFLSGLDAFIVFGGLTLLEIILRRFGADTYILRTYVTGVMFVPCVMFNATTAAAGYAAKKKKLKAWDIQTRLQAIQEPGVFAIGFAAGIFGYLLLLALNAVGFPADNGSVSVMLAATIYRLIFPRKRVMNKAFRHILRGFWWLLKEMVIVAVLSVVTVYVYRSTKELSLCFALSALSLELQKHTRLIPTTHHTTMCAALCFSLTGSLFLSILAGMAAHLIFVLFSGFFNMECGTHIDGPAVAISLVSLVLFTL